MKNRGANMPYKLYTLYFLYFAGYISFFSFYALYLAEHGLSKSFLGLLSTGTAVANFISLVGTGVLADHMLSPRKIILASGAASALWGFILLWGPNALPLALLAVVPVSFLDFALLGSLDAWINLAARHNSQIKYSVARGIGGLSGACVSLILGAVLQVIGRGRIVWFHFAFYLLVLLVAFQTADVQRPQCKQGKSPSAKLWQNRRYLLFLAASLLLFLGWRALLTYLPALVVDFGGGSVHQGLIMAVMSFGAMLVLGLYPRLRRRAGTTVLLGAGAVFMALRMLCMVFVHSMAPLILVQLLEAVSYGLFQPAAMEYIGSITPVGTRATALSVYTAVQMPAGTILANTLAIPLLQAGSVCGMFAVFSALALLGALLLLFSLRYGGGALRKVETTP